MELISWLVLGLIAGAIARLVVPGDDPMGWLGTIALGVVGSFVGGFLGNLLVEGDAEIRASGLIGSIVGAVIALLVWRALGAKRPTGD